MTFDEWWKSDEGFSEAGACREESNAAWEASWQQQGGPALVAALEDAHSALYDAIYGSEDGEFARLSLSYAQSAARKVSAALSEHKGE